MTTTVTKLIWSGGNWASSTYYPVGYTVKNGSNLYRVTVAGTSAVSGGPTGTGSGIIDNGVTWNYIGAGPDYSSLSNWEAGLAADITAGGSDTIQQARCYAFQDTTACSLSGTTTDSTHYLDIDCVSGESFQGGNGWDASKYNLTGSIGSSSPFLNVSDSNVFIRGIQVRAITTGWALGIQAGCTIEKCIFTGDLAGIGPVAVGSNITATLRNCLIYGGSSLAGVYNGWFGTPTLVMQNCTVTGNSTYGIQNASGTCTLTNCYSGGNGTDAYSGTMTRTTCAHDTATSFTGSTGNVSYNTSNFTLLSGSSGPNSPGTVNTRSRGAGTVDWVNPSNITANDSSYATATLSGLFAGNSDSLAICPTNFGFSVSVNAPLTSLLIESKDLLASSFTVGNTSLYFIDRSGNLVSNPTIVVGWKSTTTEQYNSATTRLSTPFFSGPITLADVNNSNFGIGLAWSCSNLDSTGGRQVKVNHVRLTVYWDANLHLPSGSALIGAGTDLSGTFTDDIDGNTRSTWDIGAYKGPAAAPSGGPFPFFVDSGAMAGGMQALGL